MSYKFDSYESLIMIIKKNIDKTEDNYLISETNFQKYCPDSANFLKGRFFVTSPFANGSEIRVRRCSGQDDFNQFVDGRFNEPPVDGTKPVFQNHFYTNDNDGLSCKCLFQPREYVYYLK